MLKTFLNAKIAIKSESNDIETRFVVNFYITFIDLNKQLHTIIRLYGLT